MMSLKFQRKVFENERNNGKVTAHGKYDYFTEWHCGSGTVWVIRRKRDGRTSGGWEWLQPLDERIKGEAEA